MRCYGKTRALEDIKTRMKAVCWCETKSPQGACCLATVTKCVQAVVAGRATATVPVHVSLINDCCASRTHLIAAKSKEIE